jgi:hypothetical protein
MGFLGVTVPFIVASRQVAILVPLVFCLFLSGIVLLKLGGLERMVQFLKEKLLSLHFISVNLYFY